MQHLDHEQRTRLIKSTRKLGAVLGTVPTIEIDTPTTDRPTHKVSLSLAPPASSGSRSLVLRLQGLPSSSIQLPPFSPTGSINLDASKRSSVLAVPPIPSSFRRQKMAKLARTLGENIPPELVFPNADVDASSEKPHSRVRSDSMIIIQPSPSTTPVSFDNLDSSSSEDEKEKPESKPSLARKSSRKFEKEKGQEKAETKASHKPRTLTRSATQGRDRSRSHASRARAIPGRQKNGGSLEVKSSYVASPFGNDEPFGGDSWMIVEGPGQTQTETQGDFAAVNTHKKGREWSGQWNREDMEEVAMKLRQLKIK